MNARGPSAKSSVRTTVPIATLVSDHPVSSSHDAPASKQGRAALGIVMKERTCDPESYDLYLRGYAMDAVLEGQKPSKPMTRAAARRRLRALTEKAILTAHQVAGVGQYYAVQGPGIAGGVTTHRGRRVHVALFPSVSNR